MSRANSESSTFRSHRLSEARDVLTEPIPSTPLTSAPDAALMFPTLTSAQIARIASHGGDSSDQSRRSLD